MGPNPQYLVTWNGHGDALALWRIETTGALTLANSYSYSTWGAPTTFTHNAYADLGLRFLYVGREGVAWDDFGFGLGLLYMQARHYSPALGRFLQPDPSAAEANLYAYAENSPVTKVDPDGRLWWVAAFAVARVVAALAPAVRFFQRSAPTVGRLGQGAASSPKLPAALQTGANAQRGISVYSGFLQNIRVYVGITNSIARRQLEHGARFVIQAMNKAPLTRGQARAIEQAIIHNNRASLQNVINSISPKNYYYRDAVAWGEWWLRKNGYSKLIE